MESNASAMPQRLARTTIFTSKWVDLYRDRVLLATGRIIEGYHFVDFENGAVVVLVEDAVGCHGNRRNRIEAARRETREETGYESHG
jgi:8-oxo-dGTP pyrophosphatase MutT (NUDIX family)